MESPYPEVHTDPEDPEEESPVEELTFLQKTQEALAEAKATLMRPGLIGWVLKKRHQERFERAEAEKQNAITDEFQSKVSAMVAEATADLEPEEIKTLAITTVIENKRAVDELAVSEKYSGKKSSEFISFVRDTTKRTKLLVSGGSTLVLGALAWAPNAFVASRLGRTHVADHAAQIKADEARQSDALQQEMTEREIEDLDIIKFKALHRESIKAISDSMWYQREQVKKQVGPIALGSLVGTAGSGIMSGATHL